MPNVEPRRRVRGPSVGTAASSGAAIAQGLAQAGGALLGQVADQRFEAEQFEIKQLEKQQTMDAQSAVVDKNSARILAGQDIRNRFEPTQYIDEINKWEDKYDEDLLEGQSQFFSDSYNQRDFINRINGAKSLGTAMRSDLLTDTKAGFDTMLKNTSTSSDVEDVRQWALEDGTMSVDYIDKRTRERKFQVDRDMLLGLPASIALQEIDGEFGEGMDIDRKNSLRTAVIQQEKLDNDIVSIQGSVLANRLSRQLEDTSTIQEAIEITDEIDPDSELWIVGQKFLRDNYGRVTDKVSISGEQIKVNENNIERPLMRDIDRLQGLVDKGTTANNLNSVRRLTDNAEGIRDLIREQRVSGEISEDFANEMLFHIDAISEDIGTDLPHSKGFRQSTSLARVASDTLRQVGVPGFVPENIPTKDRQIYKSSIIEQVNADPERYERKNKKEMFDRYRKMDRNAKDAVNISNGITSEKGLDDAYEAQSNTPVPVPNQGLIDAIVRSSSNLDEPLTFSDAKKVAERRGASPEQASFIAIEVLKITGGKVFDNAIN